MDNNQNFRPRLPQIPNAAALLNGATPGIYPQAGFLNTPILQQGLQYVPPIGNPFLQISQPGIMSNGLRQPGLPVYSSFAAQRPLTPQLPYLTNSYLTGLVNAPSLQNPEPTNLITPAAAANAIIEKFQEQRKAAEAPKRPPAIPRPPSTAAPAVGPLPPLPREDHALGRYENISPPGSPRPADPRKHRQTEDTLYELSLTTSQSNTHNNPLISPGNHRTSFFPYTTNSVGSPKRKPKRVEFYGTHHKRRRSLVDDGLQHMTNRREDLIGENTLSAAKKKKKRKNGRRSRSTDGRSTVGKPSDDIYYLKAGNLRESAEAKPDLIKLHEEFEQFKKGLKRSTERDQIDPNIHFNKEEIAEQCSCPTSRKNRGIHHKKYPGGQKYIEPCKKLTNNAKKLFLYHVNIDNPQNFSTRRPTTVYYDGRDFEFNGFFVFSHVSLEKLPPYSFKRNFYQYEVTLESVKQEKFPENFCIKDLDLVEEYFFKDIFELKDWDYQEKCGCQMLHFMPKFIHREMTPNNKEKISYLPMAQLLLHLMESYLPVNEAQDDDSDIDDFSRIHKGALVYNPTKKPYALRIDNIMFVKDGVNSKASASEFVHVSTSLGTEEVSLKDFKSVTEDLNRLKKSLKGRAVPTRADKERLYNLQQKLNEMREIRSAFRFNDVRISTNNYYHTGLRWDVFQHSSYLNGLWKHVKFISCLHVLEDTLKYNFKDHTLLQLALTLPSYQDHSSMSHCTTTSIHNLGKKRPDFNPKAAQSGIRKRGLMNLATVMITLGGEQEDDQTKFKCQHNERLEFLGDALLDYVTSLHLFLMFPDKGAGKLTQFRMGIVQTESLYQIAKRINVEDFILLSHYRLGMVNPTFEKNFEHTLANVVEAVIGAVYLDGGLNSVDKLLSHLLFNDEPELANVWKNSTKHPLQIENPDGDREMIPKHKVLQEMCELEKNMEFQFKNIRLLARAFTLHPQGLKDPTLTGGDYNRLEFLGDAILKYVCSDYLYKEFPHHQEGHLTLLRISLINAKCLTLASMDLGLPNYIIYESSRTAKNIKTKVYSDVFEALLGAVHIDRNPKGIQYCYKIIEVSILSRLNEFIINQEWLDPKSQLQQCCLSLRRLDDVGEDYPIYTKQNEHNESGIHIFEVSVSFKGKQLGEGTGRSLKEAEKDAAKDALKKNHFEQHARQKRMIYKKFGPARTTTDTEKVEEGGEPSTPKQESECKVAELKTDQDTKESAQSVTKEETAKPPVPKNNVTIIAIDSD
ncbi:ribonuclease 3-like isoform X2 [Clytia hemisphaerica]